MKRSMVAISIASGITSALLSWFVLGGIPHIADEVSYLYQARLFSSGQLFTHEPSVPEAFTTPWDHILRRDGRWSSIYPPGWPLILTSGWWIHATWLINPILIILSALGVTYLARQLFDQRAAFFSLIAFATSPFVLMMGAGFMAHPAGLCFALWSAFFIVRGTKRDLLLAGAAAGFAFLTRPYTALFLIAPLFIWRFWKMQNIVPAALQLALGAVPFFVFFLLYNLFLFGGPFTTGYAYAVDGQFKANVWQTFRINVPWYISTLNETLWRWPWPDLLLFLPLLLPHRKWKEDLMLAVSCVSLLLAYSFFYYKDIVYGGPRYLYESVGFLAILAGRSVQILSDVLMNSFRRIPRMARPAVFLLALFAYPLFVSLPGQIEYHSRAYQGQSKELLEFLESSRVAASSLILISGDPYVFRTFFLSNPLEPEKGRRVLARDIPLIRDRIATTYKRDQTWQMDIELQFLKGENDYDDRAEIRSIRLGRIR